jgi:hypothetical protein
MAARKGLYAPMVWNGLKGRWNINAGKAANHPKTIAREKNASAGWRAIQFFLEDMLIFLIALVVAIINLPFNFHY